MAFPYTKYFKKGTTPTAMQQWVGAVQECAQKGNIEMDADLDTSSLRATFNFDRKEDKDAFGALVQAGAVEDYINANRAAWKLPKKRRQRRGPRV